MKFFGWWRFRWPLEEIRGDRVCAQTEEGWEVWAQLFGPLWFVIETEAA